MSRTTIKLNYRGFDQLRKSQKVQADLKRRADQIAAAAGPGHSTDVAAGRTRARATVATTTNAARRRESRHYSLTSAIDAGRR